MNVETKLISARLPNGSIIQIETASVSKEVDVAIGGPDFQFSDILPGIEGIAETLIQSLNKIKPQKAAIEFGLEISAKPGKLTTLLVKGEGKANLKVTFEWSSPPN
jgi:hypothetical protein